MSDALKRIGKLDDVEVRPVIASPQKSGYRNKAEFLIRNGEIGYTNAADRRFVAVESCLLVSDAINRTISAVRERLKGFGGRLSGVVIRSNEKGEVMVTFTSDTGCDKTARTERMKTLPGLVSLNFCRLKPRPVHALDGAVTRLFGADTMMSTMCGRRFFLSPQSFFQVNTSAAERLYMEAVDGLELTGNETVVDAYCGAGTIGLTAADRCKTVFGVEIVPEAIENARRNAKENGITNAEFVADDAARLLPAQRKRGLKPDAVIVDPPRKGLDVKLIDALLLVRPQKIAYVSCDPGTLARDLHLFCAGGYRIGSVQPVDLFPQTGHVETVVLLSKGEIDSRKIRVEFPLDDMEITAFREKATYPQIKEYVLEQAGLKVSSLYISQIKRKCGLDVGDSYNKPKSESAKVSQCPPEKEAAIMDALRHFGMIS